MYPPSPLSKLRRQTVSRGELRGVLYAMLTRGSGE